MQEAGEGFFVSLPARATVDSQHTCGLLTAKMRYRGITVLECLFSI
jgi:hypothetical protein